jgi:hypothetical protein
MTYQELKDFCNSLTPEQLQQKVYLSIVDSHAEKVVSAIVTKEDEYFDHGDGLGTLEEIKSESPDEWEDIIADAQLCPKGTAMLINE